ncbi:MAG: bifunctional demethylmenaquinone methyltransferase/2-methoxy-6-polyprenyl-1,4-benzoquinol methylase UbiE [Syntrophobacterales bacterium]|jgi:demethylmenaquinone methyltransferase/2-methoxy-6-polyprenyl-1,4-benzoquinol methylase|nr:bifunctional demethylmenaquinone methyltransferase/2-methoxy-6-polyprenyl-1,4-benzoquinol methylase UbiE [Syntrophobacterales bacterium]
MNPVQKNEYRGHEPQNDTPQKPPYDAAHIAREEKTRAVWKHFHTIADKYDFMNTFLSLGIHHLWKRRAVKMMGLKENDLVIDVCGGTGDLARRAVRAMQYQGQVIIYDINSAMMLKGLEKIRKMGLEDHICCVQGNAESLSFPSHLFDAAMIGFGIRNVTNREACLREIYRVLKPGGKFMCLEFSLPASSWFRALYDFYSFRVMPLLGKHIAGSREAYLHLPESIRRFPLPPVFAEMIRDAGFSDVSHTSMTKGIVVVYQGCKK